MPFVCVYSFLSEIGAMFLHLFFKGTRSLTLSGWMMKGFNGFSGCACSRRSWWQARLGSNFLPTDKQSAPPAFPYHFHDPLASTYHFQDPLASTTYRFHQDRMKAGFEKLPLTIKLTPHIRSDNKNRNHL